MSDFAEPEMIPELIRQPFGTANCDVRYPDGTVANIPQNRYEWERRNGRLRSGYRLVPTGPNTHKPSLSQLKVCAKKTASTRLRPPAFRPSIASQDTPQSSRLSPSSLVAALQQTITPRRTASADSFEFPGYYDECRSLEEQSVLYEFIRGARSVSVIIDGKNIALDAASNTTSGRKHLTIRCHSRDSLLELQKLVNDIRSRG